MDLQIKQKEQVLKSGMLAWNLPYLTPNSFPDPLITSVLARRREK